MKWVELLKKSTEYARKSIEELTEALRNAGPSPSYEPAYSKYRNRHNQFPPQKKVNFSHESNMNLWGKHRYYHSQHNYHHHHSWGRKSHFHRRGGNHGRCGGRLLSKLMFKLMRIIARKRPGLAFYNHVSFNSRLSMNSRFLHSKPSNALSALVSSFHPQMDQDISSRSRGFSFMPQLREQYVLNSPFQMLKSTCMTGISSTPTAAGLIQHNLSSSPAFKSQNVDNRRKSDISILRTAFARTVAERSGSFDGNLSDVGSASEVSASQFGDNEYLSDLSLDNVLSSALDFDINPRLALPLVSELTDATVSSIGEELEMQRSKLQLILNEFKRVSELGELPVSVEQNGSVLRIHFPNCDPEQLRTLCDEKGVIWGKIVEIISPNSHLTESELQSIRSSHSSAASSIAPSVSSGTQSVSGNSSNGMWNQILDGVPELTESMSSGTRSGSGSASLSTFSFV